MPTRFRPYQPKQKLLLPRAGETDAAEDARYGEANRGDEIPKELCRRQSLQAAIQAAKERLEAEQRAIELAIAGNAEWIITGNVRDIAAGELVFDSFRIATPGAWLKEDV